MSTDARSVEIVICLGSSCFARGNAGILETLIRYAEKRVDEIHIRLTGRLCQDQCKQGPNLMIGGEIHHNVTAAKLQDLLQRIDERSRGMNGTA